MTGWADRAVLWRQRTGKVVVHREALTGEGGTSPLRYALRTSLGLLRLGGRVLGLAAGSSDEVGFEELAESRLDSATLRSNTPTRARRAATVARNSEMRSTLSSGFPYTSALASSLVTGKVRSHFLQPAKRLSEILFDVGMIKKNTIVANRTQCSLPGGSRWRLLSRLQPPCVIQSLDNRDQQGQESELCNREHMLWLDVEANDPDGHDDHRPTHQCLGPVAVDQIPILFRFKSFSNTEAISAVHLDLAEVERKAHSDQYESQANERGGGLGIYGFHEATLIRTNSQAS